MNLALLSAVSNQAEEITYDEDAQTYFTALDGAGITPTDGQKTAISDWVAACKGTAGDNWSNIIGAYLPIWGDATANALSIKRSTSGTPESTIWNIKI